MDKFSPSLMKLWKEWNVRVTVLLSLMLQIVLILLGKCRKHDSKFWIRIVIWCAYLSADFVATYALGVITNNMLRFHGKSSGSIDAHTELTAFWAPFLLMHLGGPDTITAYSLEDNELWLRHFLGLVVQMVMAIYVFVMAWTGSVLSFMSLLMFFVGLIKYGERTWVLRKASQEKIRDSFEHLKHPQLQSFSEDFGRFAGDTLLDAYCLMNILFQPLFLDLSISTILEATENHSFFESSLEHAFQIAEMSLAFMYDKLYTKAFLLYSHGGLGLRVITVFLTSSVSVLFPFLIHKHKFSKTDVNITFILLFGAVILEIYSALLLLLSDRFQLWLKRHQKCLMMFKAFERVLPKKKRWSNKMSQLNLLSFTIKEKPLPCNFLKQFSIVQKLENQWYATNVEIPNDLKNLILSYLKTKRHPIPLSDIEIPNDLKNLILSYLKTKRHPIPLSDNEIPNGNLNGLRGINFSEIHNDLKILILTYLKSKRDQTTPSESIDIEIPIELLSGWLGIDLSEIPNDLKNLILNYLEIKRDQTTPSKRPSIHVPPIEFTKEIEKSIIAWHVATEFHYQMDPELDNREAYVIELICNISRYMFSLLVLHPDMVSNANTTKFTLQPILEVARRSSFGNRFEACQNLNKVIRDAASEIETFSRNLAGADRRILDFYETELPTVLKQLDEKPWEERWMTISYTWLEMLLYVAYKCRGMQHAQQLKRGGEFLTHVWLLTKTLGFNENDFTSHVPNWARSIIDFGDAISRRHTSSIIRFDGAYSSSSRHAVDDLNQTVKDYGSY